MKFLDSFHGITQMTLRSGMTNDGARLASAVAVAAACFRWPVHGRALIGTKIDMKITRVILCNSKSHFIPTTDIKINTNDSRQSLI